MALTFELGLCYQMVKADQTTVNFQFEGTVIVNNQAQILCRDLATGTVFDLYQAGVFSEIFEIDCPE